MSISEEMPKKVRHLNRKLKEVIRKVNAMENVRVVIRNPQPTIGKWTIGDKDSVLELQ